MDDFSRIFLILGFTRESKFVLGLAIRDLVDPKQSVKRGLDSDDGLFLPEPFISGFDQAGAMPPDIINVIQLASKRIEDIDDDDFPISLALV